MVENLKKRIENKKLMFVPYGQYENTMRKFLNDEYNLLKLLYLYDYTNTETHNELCKVITSELSKL